MDYKHEFSIEDSLEDEDIVDDVDAVAMAIEGANPYADGQHGASSFSKLMDEGAPGGLVKEETEEEAGGSPLGALAQLLGQGGLEDDDEEEDEALYAQREEEVGAATRYQDMVRKKNESY